MAGETNHFCFGVRPDEEDIIDVSRSTMRMYHRSIRAMLGFRAKLTHLQEVSFLELEFTDL